MLLLNLAELLDFSDLYIKLYVFDDAKSDSDLKKWIGWTYTHLSRISAINQLGKPPMFGQPAFKCCDSL